MLPGLSGLRSLERFWLVVLAALALAVRTGVVLATSTNFRAINDAADYHRLAASLARGHG